MSRLISILLVFQFGFAPILQADSLTDTLNQIKSTLADPEQGLKATYTKLHKEYATNYLRLLQTDLNFFATLFLGFRAELQNHHKLLTVQLGQLEERRKELVLNQSLSPSEKMRPLNLLAEQVSRMESDSKRLSFWEDSLERARQVLLDLIENPCPSDRLKFVKATLDASLYFQRRSIGVDHFAAEIESIFADLQGIQVQNSDLYSQFSSLENYARTNSRPPFSIGYKYYSQGGGQVSDGTQTTAIIATVGVAAKLQASSMAASAAASSTAMMTSTVLTAVSTGCMIVAAAAVIYAVGSYLAAAIERVHERNDQMDIVREINDIIRNSVLSKQESDSIIETICSSLKNQDQLAAALTLLKEQTTHLDWTSFANAAAPFWQSFETNRLQVSPPDVKSIQLAMKSALTGARYDLGFQHLLRTRIYETVTEQNKSGSRDPLASLEWESEKRALRSLVEESGLQGEQKKATEDLLK